MSVGVQIPKYGQRTFKYIKKKKYENVSNNRSWIKILIFRHLSWATYSTYVISLRVASFSIAVKNNSIITVF